MLYRVVAENTKVHDLDTPLQLATLVLSLTEQDIPHNVFHGFSYGNDRKYYEGDVVKFRSIDRTDSGGSNYGWCVGRIFFNKQYKMFEITTWEYKGWDLSPFCRRNGSNRLSGKMSFDFDTGVRQIDTLLGNSFETPSLLQCPLTFEEMKTQVEWASNHYHAFDKLFLFCERAPQHAVELSELHFKVLSKALTVTEYKEASKEATTKWDDSKSAR